MDNLSEQLQNLVASTPIVINNNKPSETEVKGNKVETQDLMEQIGRAIKRR